MPKKADRIKITASKATQIQNYKQGLRQRRVSGTAGFTDSSFDDTASLPSYHYDTVDVPRMAVQKATGNFSKDWKTIGIIVTVIAVIVTATLRFGALEKAVEFLQIEITDIKRKIIKIEDDQKKDYRDLNEKYNDHALKNKK